MEVRSRKPRTSNTERIASRSANVCRSRCGTRGPRQDARQRAPRPCAGTAAARMPPVWQRSVDETSGQGSHVADNSGLHQGGTDQGVIILQLCCNINLFRPANRFSCAGLQGFPSRRYLKNCHFISAIARVQSGKGVIVDLEDSGSNYRAHINLGRHGLEAAVSEEHREAGESHVAHACICISGASVVFHVD